MRKRNKISKYGINKDQKKSANNYKKRKERLCDGGKKHKLKLENYEM